MMEVGIERSMSADGANSAQRPASPQQGASSRGGRIERVAVALRRGILLGLGIFVLALACGFLWFLGRVPGGEVALTRNAEGIVVLTGGASRVVDAIELLAAGRGQRLLITGVNPATHSTELARLTPRYQRLFACCVDLDHSAVNTIGNAIETRRWTRARGFRSLLVVTSAYHMPRAMAELAHQLPDVTLIEFPVVTEQRRNEPWWSSLASAKLLVSEYLKFVVALARMHFAPAAEQPQMTATSAGG
jgi:uncharacterized SAM-binding protein YcdF (DUF218 family)